MALAGDPLTEAELTENVRHLAKLLDVLVFHVRDSRGSMGPGFPDLVLAGYGGTLFREVKSARGRLTDAQWTWGYALLAGGQDWAVWRPGDWPEQIRAELEKVSGAQSTT